MLVNRGDGRFAGGVPILELCIYPGRNGIDHAQSGRLPFENIHEMKPLPQDAQ
jgi:hypothetical protein